MRLMTVIYNTKDYDKNLIIDERTNAVAKRITRFLKENDRFAKTIVFCVDIDHAERMRQALVNENSDLVAENNPSMSCALPATTPRARRSSTTSSQRIANIP